MVAAFTAYSFDPAAVLAKEYVFSHTSDGASAANRPRCVRLTCSVGTNYAFMSIYHMLLILASTRPEPLGHDSCR